MKIKCENIISEHTQEQQDKSSWLTRNKEYIVLAIEVYPTKVLYLIVDDSSNQVPGMHNAKQFKIVSDYIPSNWEINSGDTNIITIGPMAWQKEYFWEKCYEGDKDSLEIYKQEVGIIYTEENELKT